MGSVYLTVHSRILNRTTSIGITYSGDEDDMLAAELLLELTNEAGLDLLILLQLGDRHVDDDTLLVSDLYLLQ